jgi:hypothetical protein
MASVFISLMLGLLILNGSIGIVNYMGYSQLLGVSMAYNSQANSTIYSNSTSYQNNVNSQLSNPASFIFGPIIQLFQVLYQIVQFFFSIPIMLYAFGVPAWIVGFIIAVIALIYVIGLIEVGTGRQILS